MAGQHRAGGGVDPGPQPQRVPGAAFTTHVQVAVPQAGLLAGRFVELERQCCTLPQDRQHRCIDLNLSGRDLCVGVALGADLDKTLDGNTELRTQAVGLSEHVRVAEHHL